MAHVCKTLRDWLNLALFRRFSAFLGFFGGDHLRHASHETA